MLDFESVSRTRPLILMTAAQSSRCSGGKGGLVGRQGVPGVRRCLPREEDGHGVVMVIGVSRVVARLVLASKIALGAMNGCARTGPKRSRDKSCLSCTMPSSWMRAGYDPLVWVVWAFPQRDRRPCVPKGLVRTQLSEQLGRLVKGTSGRRRLWEVGASFMGTM